MVTFELEDTLKTGVIDIDKAHEKMLMRFGELVRAVREKKAQHFIEEYLSFLEAYAKEHFIDEESLMRSVGYPEYLAHRIAHDAFEAEVKKFIEEYKRGHKSVLVVRLGNFVADWLRSHLYKHDLALATWLREGRPIPLVGLPQLRQNLARSVG